MNNLNKKILVTGGAGFVGGHFCELALEKGYDVVIVDVFNDETSSLQEKSVNIKYIEDTAKNNKANLKVYPCSITDEGALNKIFKDEQPNILVHAASLVKDRWSMVVPLSHLHFFSKKSSEVMLTKSGFKILFIKEFSFVEPRRLIRNTLKLPFLVLQDIFSLNIKNILFRFFETFLNILDLLKGDQIKIVAYKIK